MDASDWMKGIFFSVLASWIGAASKLAIRKSWLMEEDEREDIMMADRQAENRGYQGPSWEDLTAGNRNNPHPHHPHQQQHTSSGDVPLPASKCDNPNEAGVTMNDDQCLEDEESRLPRARSAYTAVTSRSSSSLEEPAAAVAVARPTRDRTTSMELAMESTPLLLADRVDQLCRVCWGSSCCGCCFCCCRLSKFLRFSGMMGMTFVNPACCLVAMNYASPSILAPFSGLTLVWVIVFSRPLVGEEPSISQKVASALIITGEVIVAVFGDHTNEDEADRASVEASYKEGPFLAYFAGMAIWMGFIAVCVRSDKVGPTLRRFAWGTSGGSVTGLAQCFIKDSLMVAKTADVDNRVMVWYLPIFISLAIGFSFGGLLFLTATMKRYDATYSAAMFVGSFVVSTSLMSVAHYHTFHNLKGVVEIVMYPSGLLVLMVGVSILIIGRASRMPRYDSSDRLVALAPGDHYLDIPEAYEPLPAHGSPTGMMATTQQQQQQQEGGPGSSTSSTTEGRNISQESLEMM